VQQQLPWWGASYFVGWDATRSTTNNIYSNFNPRLNSNLSLSYVQPLLQNFKIDSARTQLVVSQRNRDISDIDLRTIVVQTVRNVKNAYWELKYAIANLEVQRQSLELARQTLKDNRTRVEVGTMAPIDIVEAEAEVARNEEAVIIAEAAIKQAEDNLRAIIFDPASTDFWRLVLDPIDAPEMDPRTVDLDEAVRNALELRTDVRRAKESLANVDTNLEFYRNQTLPQLNLQVDYGATGLGGTQSIRGGEGFPPPIIGEASRSFWDVQGDVFGANFPGWTIGAYVAYPLGKSSAEAIYARTRLEQHQALLQMKNLELQVGTEVRDVARSVNTNTKRVDATRASRVLSERRLEAEQKKFGVGMSTSFLVFQAQRDLSTARANELRAILDLNQSLADFEAVQEAALSGRGITISSGGGVLATSAGATIATGLRQQNR
jgi:outer membrane protein TolC